MKKIAVILFALMSTNAIANPKCDIVLEYATSIMEARQIGVSAPDMMQAADDAEVAGDLMRALTIDAYKQSRYDSESIQDAVIEEFGYKHYLNCLQQSK